MQCVDRLWIVFLTSKLWSFTQNLKGNIKVTLNGKEILPILNSTGFHASDSTWVQKIIRQATLNVLSFSMLTGAPWKQESTLHNLYKASYQKVQFREHTQSRPSPRVLVPKSCWGNGKLLRKEIKQVWVLSLCLQHISCCFPSCRCFCLPETFNY